MYQALYRKWRPQVFADVVGQQHITTTLMNEINADRHSHAYLFTGSRGTGKTTCAKIFAKAVNCEHPINGDPCNSCETCRGIDNGSIMDVIEIDAASNNGVDNIRDIRDEANFTPVNGKYRVYIIDEVHMLSAGAFNALLKTLEEPPPHVKFVLATTEVHKLPATILSRCQRFDFKRITPEDIASRLAFVAEKEGLILHNDAAMLIAGLADGALRDALSILDQCIGHGTEIDLSIVNETVGLAGREYLFALSDFIYHRNGAAALEKINELHNRSCDMERLCGELINHFRNIMVCKAVKSPQNLVVCSEAELDDYRRAANEYSMDRILEVLAVLDGALANLRKGLNRRIETEMAIIRLCSLSDGSPVSNQPSTASVAQPKVAEKPIDAATVQRPNKAVAEKPIETAPEHVSLTESLPDGAIPTNVWNAVIREAVSADKALIGTMNSAKVYKAGNTLRIYTDNALLRHFVDMEEHRQVIYNATFTVIGEYLRPVAVDEEPPTETPTETPIETPIEAPTATPIEAPTEAPTAMPIETSTVPSSEPSTNAPTEDPLDGFINTLSQLQTDEKIDFNLFIEE